MFLPQLREALGLFCTEGQWLHPFQHILGRRPTGTRKRTKQQPGCGQKAGIMAQGQLENRRRMDRSLSCQNENFILSVYEGTSLCAASPTRA